jgi:hypothetical protein
MTTAKVDPSPGLLSSSTRPPWARAIADTIASPSPLLSGCRNPPAPEVKRSKIRWCSSAAMPGPPSATQSRTSPSRADAPSSMRSPSRVYCAAL